MHHMGRRHTRTSVNIKMEFTTLQLIYSESYTHNENFKSLHYVLCQCTSQLTPTVDRNLLHLVYRHKAYDLAVIYVSMNILYYVYTHTLSLSKHNLSA